MKKFFYLSALSLGMMCSITACSDDDTTTIDAKNLDYTAENASSWGNYMRVVAQLLVNDATALYDDWAVKYNILVKTIVTISILFAMLITEHVQGLLASHPSQKQ